VHHTELAWGHGSCGRRPAQRQGANRYFGFQNLRRRRWLHAEFGRHTSISHAAKPPMNVTRLRKWATTDGCAPKHTCGYRAPRHHRRREFPRPRDAAANPPMNDSRSPLVRLGRLGAVKRPSMSLAHAISLDRGRLVSLHHIRGCHTGARHGCRRTKPSQWCGGISHLI
jgi:hypothetical protein